MLEVKFYEQAEDALLKYAVIIAKCADNWVLCKHRDRDTWEIPGGHREAGETILEAAKRELYEETGAVAYEICPISVYSVLKDGVETFGMLFFAEVSDFEDALHNEIEKIGFFEWLPENWTYPLIQPKLMEEYLHRLSG